MQEIKVLQTSPSIVAALSGDKPQKIVGKILFVRYAGFYIVFI